MTEDELSYGCSRALNNALFVFRCRGTGNCEVLLSGWLTAALSDDASLWLVEASNHSSWSTSLRSSGRIVLCADWDLGVGSVSRLTFRSLSNCSCSVANLTVDRGLRNDGADGQDNISIYKSQ